MVKDKRPHCLMLRAILRLQETLLASAHSYEGLCQLDCALAWCINVTMPCHCCCLQVAAVAAGDDGHLYNDCHCAGCCSARLAHRPWCAVMASVSSHQWLNDAQLTPISATVKAN